MYCIYFLHPDPGQQIDHSSKEISCCCCRQRCFVSNQAWPHVIESEAGIVVQDPIVIVGGEDPCRKMLLRVNALRQRYELWVAGCKFTTV